MELMSQIVALRNVMCCRQHADRSDGWHPSSPSRPDSCSGTLFCQCCREGLLSVQGCYAACGTRFPDDL